MSQPGTPSLPELQNLLVKACTAARRDFQTIIPLVENAAGMSASSLRNTLGLINTALVAAKATDTAATAVSLQSISSEGEPS